MERADFFEIAPGRLQLGPTVAVIDIGSNSVRLVVYEALTRSPTPIFNEKALCGLGRNVLTSGRLADEAVARALASIRRFRVLCTQLNVGELHVLATAAVRDARNGPDFVAECEAICGVPLRLLSGREEATFAALGVVSGTYQPDGIVGDLGGGSLELVDIKGERIGGEGARRATKHVARELVEHDDEGKNRFGGLFPVAERAGGGGLVGRQETGRDGAVESLVLDEPEIRAGIAPEGENLGRGRDIGHRAFIPGMARGLSVSAARSGWSARAAPRKAS